MMWLDLESVLQGKVTRMYLESTFSKHMSTVFWPFWSFVQVPLFRWPIPHAGQVAFLMGRVRLTAGMIRNGCVTWIQEAQTCEQTASESGRFRWLLPLRASGFPDCQTPGRSLLPKTETGRVKAPSSSFQKLPWPFLWVSLSFWPIPTMLTMPAPGSRPYQLQGNE